MTYDHERAAKVADTLIRKHGARCVLRRASGDRDCYVVITDYSPRERTDMIEATDRVALVSPVDLDIPPDREQGDKLVTFLADNVTEDQVFLIVAPSGKLQQARTVIYWELQVRPE